MKQLKRLLNDTADQMLSTFLLVFSVYCLVQGVIGLVKTPPPLWVPIVVAGFGFFLGVVKFATYKNPTYSAKEDKMED